MHGTQIKSARDTDDGTGNHQHRDAQRIGRHAVQRCRRHDCAERRAEQHQQHTQERRRDQHRPPCQRRRSNSNDGARQIARRHAGEPQRQAASCAKRQRLRNVAERVGAAEGWR